MITGAFVNAQAVIEYIRKRSPSTLSLISTGAVDKKENEDDICAKYIAERLLNRPVDFAKIYKEAKACSLLGTFF